VFTEVGSAVAAAVCRVLELDAAAVGPMTRLDEVGADSLARVEIAELTELALEANGVRVHISDEDLDAALTVGELAARFLPVAR
jgi:acyl carrier protein